MALPKKHRFSMQSQTRILLRRKGKHLATPLLHAYYRFGESEQSRFGVVVGSSISKKAVVRNRLRRLFHEAIYDHLSTSPNIDMIIFPKKKTTELGSEEVHREVGRLFTKIHLQ